MFPGFCPIFSCYYGLAVCMRTHFLLSFWFQDLCVYLLIILYSYLCLNSMSCKVLKMLILLLGRTLDFCYLLLLNAIPKLFFYLQITQVYGFYDECLRKWVDPFSSVSQFFILSMICYCNLSCEIWNSWDYGAELLLLFGETSLSKIVYDL